MQQSIFDKTYAAFLFDMDGTLLNSIVAAERVWGAWARRHGLDVAAFLPTIHGVRPVDTITRLGLPGIDIAREVDWVETAEREDVEGIVQIDGVVTFLNSIPADRWAIVTSATAELARRRMTAAGIAPPPAIVTGEDIVNGKPNPDCFLLGAKKLGVAASECLIFEDAPAGILAGERAGGDVVVITATHHTPVKTAHLTIPDYTGVGVAVQDDGRLRLVRR
mgnify:CR=1 FL=1